MQTLPRAYEEVCLGELSGNGGGRSFKCTCILLRPTHKKCFYFFDINRNEDGKSIEIVRDRVC